MIRLRRGNAPLPHGFGEDEMSIGTGIAAAAMWAALAYIAVKLHYSDTIAFCILLAILATCAMAPPV